MSQTLEPIIGRKEIVTDVAAKQVAYKQESLHLSVFTGGVGMGRSLQITIGDWPAIAHIQIGKEQVKELIETLTFHFID
jgi:hypothetical protein